MKKLIALLALTFLTFSAFGREVVIDLPVNGEYMGNQTFFLKQMIQRERPRLDLDRARLEKVEFRFKSKRGADLTLRVGQDYTTESVRGYRNDYDRRGNADRIDIFAPRDRRNQQGAWQLQVSTMREFTIRNLTVTVQVRDVVRPEPPRPQPGRFIQTCGYVRETQWGHDLQKYYRDARGDSQAEAEARACEEAKNACRRDMSSFLERCKKL